MAQYICPSPIGSLSLVEENGALVEVRWNFDLPRDAAPMALPATPLLRQAAAELTAYFAGQLRQFTVPLDRKSVV